MKDEKLENTGFYSLATEILNQEMEKNKPLGAINIEDAADRFMSEIDESCYTKEYLIRSLFSYAAASYLSKLEYASILKGQRIYISRDVLNEAVHSKLTLNEKDLAIAYGEKYAEMEKDHRIKFNRDATSGQLGIDEDGTYEEWSAERLVEFIKNA